MKMANNNFAKDMRINLDEPRWDQSTFVGRLKYFFWVTDPRAVFKTNKQLDDAKELVALYKEGKEPEGTTEEQIWYAKKLTLSAFHPDTGERQNVIGRMSFQVPGGMLITGCLLQFYRTSAAVVFWQWVNQSFNALVNYTNRNAQASITNQQIAVAYVSATSSAVVTAIGLKTFLSKRTTSTLLQRFVPFAAVAAANMVNIPLMRQSELIDGIAVFDENGKRVSESRYGAAKGISQVVFSRIAMATPGMLLTPVIMERLEKYRWMQRIKPAHVFIQTLIVGCFLLFMTPTACALFPQKCSINLEKMRLVDSKKYEAIMTGYGDAPPKKLYFNKGL
ncbi:sideroflexin-2 isoform X1 [Lingula anatina]|uniref:Sidoreflexin n=1 Tax=Lingula anatina TaxID=7574 RepID=A0A1S3IFV2_LINAN|nr:sideroflexin-2 isoform X1 [Lingula anatina]XP_013397134.1 sideroflexin-2 isoform X1 [Lingula anatina]XP_013397135.1 sideroflexin-2 isoform X1 [Lingula anatina]XP_013397136.1 sideroflexin-2 isoform X1 [Lingula anatina]|eukprot:XP_013397133.1 sideroflexin-2 isoform X1 [Lingula anatina]